MKIFDCANIKIDEENNEVQLTYIGIFNNQIARRVISEQNPSIILGKMIELNPPKHKASYALPGYVIYSYEIKPVA